MGVEYKLEGVAYINISLYTLKVADNRPAKCVALLQCHDLIIF